MSDPHRSTFARIAATTVLPLLLLAMGLFGGWFAASQRASGVATEPHEAPKAGTMSPRTLANIGVEVGEQVANENSFACAHFTRDDDEAFALIQAIFEVCICPSMSATLVEKAGIGAQLERLTRETIERLVHIRRP